MFISCGTTIILTTHYLEEAERLCDKIAIIDRGNLVISESKEEILKIIDVKEMHVKLKNPISKISSFLSKYVIFRSKDKTTIHLRYKKNIISSGEIIKKLIENKCDIKELSTKETDLEEIFLRLLKN